MRRNKLKLIVIAVVILAVAGAVFALITDDASAPGKDQSAKKEGSNNSNDSETMAFDKSKYPTDDPASLWVVVNKKNPLPSTFEPEGLETVSGVKLTKEASAAARDLISAASGENVILKGISGYRSFGTQQLLYNTYVQQDGKSAADTYSARAGFSEHQTGLAADLGNSDGSCDLETCFADTSGGKWLAAHAHEFGYVISYPKDKTSITGYQYEPWHLRYVGKELAAELYKSGQTMQEFFGLPASPTY